MDFAPFPSFSSENLSIWFAQMESAFSLNGILEESEKYDYVVTQIPTDSLKMVEDIILNPPTADKYEVIKYKFIKRMSIYKLKEVEFGNETPSEYLRKLKSIGGQRVSNEVILNIWLNNLPEKVRQIVSLETSGNLDRLCGMADKAMVLATASPPPQLIEGLSGKQFGMIMRRMKELSMQIQIGKLMADGKYDSEEDDEQQSSSHQNLQREAFNILNWKWNNSSSPKVICWYHTNFGDKAIACVAPCQYEFSPTIFNLRK